MDKHTKCKTKLKDLCELSSIDRRRRRWGWEGGVGQGKHGNLWQALTLRSSSSVFFMRTTRRLKRSSSCSSTTPVGDMLIAIIFRIRQVSKAGGRDFSIPAATWSINSSRLMPPEPSPKCRINQKRKGGSSKGKVEGELVDIGQWQKTAVMYATLAVAAFFLLLFSAFLSLFLSLFRSLSLSLHW